MQVTRKVTSNTGVCAFGGWTGKAKAASHQATVVAHGYENAAVEVQLSPGKLTEVKVTLRRSAQW